MERNNTMDESKISIIPTNNSDKSSFSSSYNVLYGVLNDAQLSINDTNENDIKCCIENIGKGAFGTVTKALDMRTGKFIIIKTIIIKHSTIESDLSFQTSVTDQIPIQSQLQSLSLSDKHTPSSDTATFTQSKLGINESNEGNNIIPATVATSTLISLTSNDKNKIEKIKKEMDIMKKLTHDNIIKYIGHTSDKSDNGYKIMIYMDDICGKPLDILFELPVTDHFINNVAYQLFTGLEYMHSQNVIHKDIKHKNILWSNEGILKIIDFGESAIVTTDQYKHIASGTPVYMCHEVIKSDTVNKQDSFKCDIWAGMIMIVELYLKTTIKTGYETGESLIYALGTDLYLMLHACLHGLLCIVKKIPYTSIDKSIPSDINVHIIPIIKEIFSISNNNHILSLVDLLCLCLEPIVTKRYNAKEVLFHPFITREIKVYKSDLVNKTISS